MRHEYYNVESVVYNSVLEYITVARSLPMLMVEAYFSVKFPSTT